ncbi:hypothetical protein EVAR_53301_1 [Eumeta japonica]|uniref:Uncharacterized protein n=1 Tax=Eumeta variegata TaxID=151549 RepID=A0A4C1X5U9_EUMVA|nr:hypothetical protein EVAR_53301_1 [Eumeta japonica]
MACVGLRACTSVWGATQCKSRGELSHGRPSRDKLRLPCRLHAEHTVSAPRERSRSFHSDADRYFGYFACLRKWFCINCVVLAIFASSRGNIFTRTLLLRWGNPEGFLTFAPLAPVCFLAA